MFNDIQLLKTLVLIMTEDGKSDIDFTQHRIYIWNKFYNQYKRFLKVLSHVFYYSWNRFIIYMKHKYLFYITVQNLHYIYLCLINTYWLWTFLLNLNYNLILAKRSFPKADIRYTRKLMVIKAMSTSCFIINNNIHMHNKVAVYIHWCFCKRYNLEITKPYYEHKSPPVSDNKNATILYGP